MDQRSARARASVLALGVAVAVSGCGSSPDTPLARQIEAVDQSTEGMAPDDVTEVVLRRVPLGTSISEAERILSVSGFHVVGGRRPDVPETEGKGYIGADYYLAYQYVRSNVILSSTTYLVVIGVKNDAVLWLDAKVHHSTI